ncbi:MAG: IspD/TarI family cytidylyltransferase [Bacteroidia bacterium]
MSLTGVFLAAGKGLRFGRAVPKQFVLYRGLPVYLWGLKRFWRAFPASPALVVVPREYQDTVRDTLKAFRFSWHIIFGGQMRSESVSAAVKWLRDRNQLTCEHLIAFHDAARPFASVILWRRLYAAAQEKGCAIPIVSVVDSLRYYDGVDTQALARENYFLVQTPQIFRGDLIARATSLPHIYSDEASWLEAAGITPNLVEGSPFNRKITTRADRF